MRYFFYNKNHVLRFSDQRSNIHDSKNLWLHIIANGSGKARISYGGCLKSDQLEVASPYLREDFIELNKTSLTNTDLFVPMCNYLNGLNPTERAAFISASYCGFHEIPLHRGVPLTKWDMKNTRYRLTWFHMKRVVKLWADVLGMPQKYLLRFKTVYTIAALAFKKTEPTKIKNYQIYRGRRKSSGKEMYI